jgi:hypothetical protein
MLVSSPPSVCFTFENREFHSGRAFRRFREVTMRISATFVLALFAVSVRAQPAPAAIDDEPASWSDAIRARVPADELASALSSKRADFGADPLLDLAQAHGLDAPAWLQARVREQGTGATLAALGDSLSAASYSCSSFYCPSNSWSTGDMASSVLRRLEAQSGRRVRGLMVAVPGVEIDALPAEAFAVYLASAFGLNVERMTLLIGHNDPGVCRPDKPGELQRFERDVSLALNILGRVARRRGAKLYVGGLMEADSLARDADVVPDGASTSCGEIWRATGRCSDLLQRRGEPARLDEARARIAADDEILRRLTAGKAWILYSGAFTASTRDGIADPVHHLSRYDCFHPSPAGQSLLADAAWNGASGQPGLADFFALGAPRPLASGTGAPADPRVLQVSLEAWSLETSRRER